MGAMCGAATSAAAPRLLDGGPYDARSTVTTNVG
jgi:hypothetical protein